MISKQCIWRSVMAVTLVGALVAFASPSRGDTATFQENISPNGVYDVEDTDIRNSAPNTNQEGNPRWNAGFFNTVNYRSPIIFPISLPANSVIYSATISVRQSASGSVGTQTQVNLHEITNANYNDETTVTWNSAHAATPWTSAGGDFSATILSSLTPTGIVNNDPYVFGSTAAFVAAANAALNGDGKLRLLLRADVETEGHLMSFWSSDSGSDAISGFGTGVRPVLTLLYVPEPASLALLAVGGLAASTRRRHSA